jgi:MFS family permease
MMRSSLRPIASLLLGVAFLLAGNGLHVMLVPLRGGAESFSALALGLIGSAYFAGFVSGCLLGPYVVLRAGHIRAFAAMVAIAASVALAYALVPHPVAWGAFRAMTGFCLASLYLVIESWLNDHATNATRGLVMSAYIVVNFCSIALGQMLVTLYPIQEAGSFIVSAMLLSLAIVPVALTRSAQPAPITIVSFRPWQLFRAAPAALVGACMIGFANGAFWTLAPVFAGAGPRGVDHAAQFMTGAVLAGALVQWPLGRLSDRIDRRLVLLVLLLGAIATSLALWMLPASGMFLLALGGAFGAFVLPGYSLAAAHGYDKTPRGDAVATAATILLANGLGSVAGPPFAAMLMANRGPSALFMYTALIQGLLAAYLIYRIRVQASLDPPEKTGFELGASTPVGGVVTRERPDPQDALVAVPDDCERAGRSTAPGTDGER